MHGQGSDHSQPIYDFPARSQAVCLTPKNSIQFCPRRQTQLLKEKLSIKKAVCTGTALIGLYLIVQNAAVEQPGSICLGSDMD
jgi:hypothetical protein